MCRSGLCWFKHNTYGFSVVQSLSCVWLFCNSVDCSPPGSSVHGILQARILEWVAISFSRGFSRPRDQTHACNAGDLGSIPGSGRSTEERNGYPLQYSCLENIMDRGAWQATVHGVAESVTTETHSRKATIKEWHSFKVKPVHLLSVFGSCHSKGRLEGEAFYGWRVVWTH